MKRRNFIKNVLGAGVVGSSCLFRTPFSISSAQASHNGETQPTLIVIFQRGGCDGLNVVVPYGDETYYNLRPTISVAQPDVSNPLSAIPVNDESRGVTNFFGLHPSMRSLLPIYDAGEMAILPTVQYPESSHSHFDGQHFIESGALVKESDGWLNRHLSTRGNTGGLQAVNFGSSLSQAMRGSVLVQSFSSIRDFNLGLGSSSEAELIANLSPIYNSEPSSSTEYQRLVYQFGQILFNNIEDVRRIDTVNYMPENGAVYPRGRYGQRLRETAQLIKEDVGLALVTVDIDGWDTHSGQGGGEPGGRQAKLLQEFSRGISALHSDLGDLMDNVVILTMTEFGRTAHENGSGGTDHGDAASWFLIGRNIQGGIHGQWPGLMDDQLVRGRYLKYTVDYRDVFGDILLSHLEHNSSELGMLLPGHDYRRLGLFS